MDKPKILTVFKVRAIPLKERTSSASGIPYDYTLSYKKGLQFQVEESGDAPLKAALQKIGKAAFASAKMLSYSYKEGDSTVFEMTFKFGKIRRKFSFVT